MVATVVGIYRELAVKEFTNDKGEQVKFNQLLMEDPEQTNARLMFLNFTVPTDVYDSINATELNSLVGKKVMLKGSVMAKFNGGMRFVVQEIERFKE